MGIVPYMNRLHTWDNSVLPNQEKMELKDQIAAFLWLLCGKSTGRLICRCDTGQAIP